MNTNTGNNSEWRRNNRRDSNSALTGIFLILLGGFFFLSKLNLGLPYWLFSWKTLLIAIGLFIGVRHSFRGPAWLILILIGGLALQPDILPFFNITNFTWPIILVVLGLYIIVRPKSGKRKTWNDLEAFQQPVEEESVDGDRIDITSILGGVKKVVVSKNFKGGEIVSFLGGSDINLSQADINGKVRLEATNVMGGTKLIVPSNWDVQSELVAIFGGVEDKRDLRSAIIDPNKVLVLEGTCLFGGIEIKSY